MKINYDVKLSEIETGFMLFWKKYNLQRGIIFSAIYTIAAVLFINMIVVSRGDGIIPWIGAALALGMLASTWLRPLRAKKRLGMALEFEYIDSYIATFGEQAIEVETVTAKGEESDELAAPGKSKFVIATEELCSAETPELFLLYVNRAFMHIFPKRCMSEGEVEELRKYFEEKKI